MIFWSRSISWVLTTSVIIRCIKSMPSFLCVSCSILRSTSNDPMASGKCTSPSPSSNVTHKLCNTRAWSVIQIIFEISRYNEKNLRKIVNDEYYEKLSEKRGEVDYLNQCIIYLQEFKSDSLSQLSSLGPVFSRKFVRILLNKKLWVSKHADNAKICMKFSQFNDETELKSYQRVYFTIDPKTITNVFSTKKVSNFQQKIRWFQDLIHFSIVKKGSTL